MPFGCMGLSERGQLTPGGNSTTSFAMFRWAARSGHPSRTSQVLQETMETKQQRHSRVTAEIHFTSWAQDHSQKNVIITGSYTRVGCVRALFLRFLKETLRQQRGTP